MGLDMYLYKREFISGYTDKARFDALVEIFGASPESIVSGPHFIVDVEVAYWRKANEIHHWFVRELGDGIDECQIIWVGLENLLRLREICARIIESPELAPVLLPTQGGFFFGGLKYDEWYMSDLKYTIKAIDHIAQNSTEDDQIYYQASW